MDIKSELVMKVLIKRLNDMYQVAMDNAGLSEDEKAEVNVQVAVLQLKDILGLTDVLDPVS